MTHAHLSVDQIFSAALALPAGDERAAYLDAACEKNAEMRQRVERLLMAHANAQSFLESPAVAANLTINQPLAEKPGTIIGPYKLLQQIGEGGMGVVYMAQQTEPMQRKVALKLIKSGMDSRQVIARFEAERQALAMMDHVNIARVLDAGTSDAGRPYFVMELVNGVPITRYCDDHQLTPRQRLKLFVPVCQAIQHAHQKGIIHRDIKPSNVMITLYDGKPVPKVIDFGVAKATEQNLTERTLITQYGTMVGTLEYMSPEQAEMSALGVDTRSDIYSLGVLLYELLTGSTPLTHKRLKEAAFVEILRMIKEDEPPKPSTRLSDSGERLASISAQRQMEPARLTKLVRGELDWIVMKTLEKDRSRRYETANGFAADVQRYLDDEPVQACPPSAGYRLGKFARRNKGPVLLVSTVALALVVGIIGTTWGLFRAIQAESHAVSESREKDEALTQVRQEQKRTRAEQGRTQAALLKARRETARMSYEQACGKCLNEGADRGVLALATSLQKAHEAELPELEHSIRLQLAGWARHLLPPRTVQPVPGRVMGFSPDGRIVAYSAEAQVRFWEVATGNPVGLPLPHPQFVGALAISADRRVVLTACSDKKVRQWEVESGKSAGPSLEVQSLTALAISPDGKMLLTGHYDKTAQLWNAESGKPLGPPLQHQATVVAAAISPDGMLGLTANGREAWLWDLETLKPPQSLMIDQPILRLTFSPDGETFLASDHQVAQMRDSRTGKAIRPALNHCLKHKSLIQALAVSPDGKTALTAGTDQLARLWEVETGSPLGAPLQHQGPVIAAAFSPDGKTVFTGTENSVYVWQRDEKKSPAVTLPLANVAVTFLPLAFSPDSKTVLAGYGKTARLWEASTARPLGSLLEHQGNIRFVAFHPQGELILTHSAGGGFRTQIWELETGKSISRFQLDEHDLTPQNLPTTSVFAADGNRVLTGNENGVTRLWDLRTRKPLAPPRQHPGAGKLAISGDGEMVMIGGSDGNVRVWKTDTGKPVGSPVVHQGFISALAFSPDAKMIATGGERTAQVWDLETGNPVGPRLQRTGLVRGLAFSPNSRIILTASDELVQLSEAETGKPVGPPLLQNNWVVSATFSPDGNTMLTGTGDGFAWLWRVGPVEGDVARIILWTQVLTGLELDDAGLVQVLSPETHSRRRRQLEQAGGAPWP